MLFFIYVVSPNLLCKAYVSSSDEKPCKDETRISRSIKTVLTLRLKSKGKKKMQDCSQLPTLN